MPRVSRASLDAIATVREGWNRFSHTVRSRARTMGSALARL